MPVFGSFSSMPLALQLASSAMIALVFLYVFGYGFPWNAAAATHSQDSTLALYWMHRTHTVSYRDWFHEEDSEANARRYGAFRALANEGNIAMPVHAIYLWVLGHCVRLYTTFIGSTAGTSALLVDFFDNDFFSFVDDSAAHRTTAKIAETLFAVRWVASLFLVPVLFQCAVESLWPLMVSLSSYLVEAADQRQKGAVVLMQTAAGQPLSAAAQAGVGTADDAAEVARRVRLKRRVATIGFLAVFVLGIVPSIALEMTTLYPVGFSACAVIRCVQLLFLDEAMLSSVDTYARDRFSSKEEDKLFSQGDVFAFPLKEPLSLRYLCEATALAAVTGLAFRPALYVLAAVAGWIATLCYIRIHRRVAVRVKAPDGASATPEAHTDGFVDIGFSSYQDKLHAHLCSCYTTACAIAVLFAVCGPFFVGRQPLFVFMDLFAPTLKTDPAHYRLTESSGHALLSMTGAREITSECLADRLNVPRHFSCPRPAVGLLTLSEYFGFPWSDMTAWFGSLIAPTGPASRRDGYMWMQYISMLALVLANAAPVLVILAYRVQKPFTTFDTPVAFALEHRRQRGLFFHFWAQQADKLREQKNYPPPERPFASLEAVYGDGGKKDEIARTCICQQEHVLKQVTALLWTMVACAVSSNLFLMRAGSALSVCGSVIVPTAVLCALSWMLGPVARSAADAFDPRRNRLAFDDLAARHAERQEEGRRQREAADEASVTAPAPAAPVEEPLEAVPEEHVTTRTFTSGNYSYTTPAFGGGGTGWYLSSRWCSPASLVEHTDGVWCVVLLLAAAIVGLQAYPVADEGTSRSGNAALGQVSRQNAPEFIIGGLLAALVYEVVSCGVWRRTDLLTVTIIAILQVAGGYAAIKEAFFAPERASRSLAVWFDSFAEVFTGPAPLFNFMSGAATGNDDGGLAHHAWACVYRSGVAAACLLLAGVHGSLRLARIMLEDQEVRYIHPAREMEMIHERAKKTAEEIAANRGQQLQQQAAAAAPPAAVRPGPRKKR